MGFVCEKRKQKGYNSNSRLIFKINYMNKLKIQSQLFLEKAKELETK